MPYFGRRSRQNLRTAHEDLQLLFNEVIKHFDCSVKWGFRGKVDQNKAFRDGFSNLKWPKSNHNVKPCRAVDVTPWFPSKPHTRWTDEMTFKIFGSFVMITAERLKIKIRWGGHWTKPDFPHYELKRS